MRLEATRHLFEGRVRLDPLAIVPDCERAELEAAREAPTRAKGTVFEVLVGGGPWRCVDSVRAESPWEAYLLACRRNPEHGHEPLLVEGPGGSFEGAGR